MGDGCWVLVKSVAFRPMAALISRESHQQGAHRGKVDHALTLMHQQRGEEEIMYEEQQEINSELTPHEKHLRPVEHKVGIAHRAHVKTQQRGCEEQAPHYQVNQVFLP